MAYVTAVTDRALSDITTPTSKGYWNVADWVRVYGNSQLVRNLAATMLATSIRFDILSTVPTITTIPSVTDFNTFLANIERTRLAVVSVPIPGTTTEIKDDYLAGSGQESPDWVDANLWESTLNAIWNHYNGGSLDVCPSLAANLTVTNGTTVIYVDCLDANGFDITIESTGHLSII